MAKLELETIRLIQETKSKRIELIELLKDIKPKKKLKKETKTHQKKAS